MDEDTRKILILMLENQQRSNNRRMWLTTIAGLMLCVLGWIYAQNAIAYANAKLTNPALKDAMDTTILQLSPEFKFWYSIVGWGIAMAISGIFAAIVYHYYKNKRGKIE